MPASVTINLGGGKSQLVKAKSSATLLQIKNTVCEKHHIASPEQHGLKSEGRFLDLSMSLRQVNLVSGAKLDLARTIKDESQDVNGNAPVSVSLLMEAGVSAAARPFAPSTTLWQILLDFEESSSGSLNLTRRVGTAQPTVGTILRRISKRNQAISRVYVQPVVIVLQREFAALPVLQTATLKDLGILSGDVTLRVSMRHTDAKVEVPNDTTPKRNKSSKAVPSNPLVALGTPNSPSLEESAFHVPTMTGRAGAVDTSSRDGHLVGPGNGAGSNSGNGESEGQRQTPTQDINSAMVEANQEIRQLREQQTQEAMTDRVKRLSKSSDGTSEKDRFVRSMPLPFIPEREENGMMAGPSKRELAISTPTMSNITTPTLATTATNSSMTTPPLSHNDLVRQIAQRVSQQLREAQERGEPTLNYHSLIAKEIVRGQRAGTLPVSPENCRQNSEYVEKTASLPPPPLLPQTPVAITAAGAGEVKMSFLERARSKNSLPKWMRLSKKGPSSSST